MKEAAPSRISNGKAKSKMAHKNGTFNKVVANSRHSVVTPEYLARTLNIGLDQAKQILRVTTQRVIRTAMHPTSIRYSTYHLDPHRKYTSGIWYVNCILAAKNIITQFRSAFLFSNGAFPGVYPNESNNSLQAAETL